MNILLSSAGRRNYLVDYFKKAIAPFGGKVFVSNSIPEASSMCVADQSFLVPEIKDPNYIAALLSICQENDVKMIVPLFDQDLSALANTNSKFEEKGILILVSGSETVSICRDKWLASNYLRKKGFRIPKTYLGLEQVRDALRQNEIDFPLLIKPRWGMGSIGIIAAENAEELEFVFRQVKRAIESSYLADDLLRDPSEDILIQEKLFGVEYGLDVVNDLNSVYITTFVKRKIAMRNGETDAAVTVDEPEMTKLGEKLSKSFSPIGNLDVDLIVSDGQTYILDVNPRFGGGYPFSHLAGANLPAAFVAWAQGNEPDPDWLRVKHGVVACKGILPLVKN